MTGFLRLLQLLAMVVWVGGLIFLAFVLAPVAFRVLPTVREAGIVVGASLRVFDVVCLACGTIFLFATGLLFRETPMRVRGRYELEFLLAAAMLIATVYIHFGILPAMERDRRFVGGDINSVELANPSRVHFDKLHQRSEQVEGGTLLLGLALIILMSREPVRFD